MNLFNEDFGTGNTEKDDTKITTTILYMSTEELKEFRKLAKVGIKEMFGEEFKQRGNLSDFLINTLKEKYGSQEN
jgi:hypothetical protein